MENNAKHMIPNMEIENRISINVKPEELSLFILCLIVFLLIIFRQNLMCFTDIYYIHYRTDKSFLFIQFYRILLEISKRDSPHCF